MGFYRGSSSSRRNDPDAERLLLPYHQLCHSLAHYTWIILPLKMARGNGCYTAPTSLTRPSQLVYTFRINSFAVMRNYIACLCVGAHLLGITRVGDTAYCVWLIVFTSDCCMGSSAPMVVHVLDCRRGFEHLTGCKWRHARYIPCRLQRCCLQRVIHALPISHGKGGLDSIT